MPVFGGWLRNIPDEGMEASWDYVRRLTQRSEQTGWDLSLIAELNLNDIKGVDEPALDAWSTAAALAAVTNTIELMVAVRPNFHQPALFAKAAANIDNIANGRLALNVVSSWWADEATQYGLDFDQHGDRYARTSEWLKVVDSLWSQKRSTFEGKYYSLKDAICEPKPVASPRPTIYAGGESESGSLSGSPHFRRPRPRASTISTSGCPAPSWSANLSYRNIASPTAAFAPTWSARPNSCGSGSRSMKPLASTSYCFR
jgi:FMNH2-dependent dimethyl sulfone monooxygenase